MSSTQQHQQYEYVRKRFRQKKQVLFHFLVFIAASVLMLLLDECLSIGQPGWCYSVSVIWFLLFAAHFLKVFVFDSIMNQNWERHQVDKLLLLNKRRAKKIEAQLPSEKSAEK